MAKLREWTMDEKLEAATALLITGTTTDASKLCGIPSRTIREWTKKDWWHSLMQEADKHKNALLSGKQTKLLEKSLNLLEERMTKGDPIVDKNGNIVGYKPVNAYHMALIHAILVDKRGVIRGVKESTKSNKTITDKLDELTDRLEKFAEKQTSFGIPEVKDIPKQEKPH